MLYFVTKRSLMTCACISTLPCSLSPNSPTTLSLPHLRLQKGSLIHHHRTPCPAYNLPNPSKHDTLMTALLDTQERAAYESGWNDTKIYWYIWRRPLAGGFFRPGRVNLIGEHTDYNGGHVFPCALDVGTYGSFACEKTENCGFTPKIFGNRCDRVIAGRPKTAGRFPMDQLPDGCDLGFTKHGYSIDKGMDLYIYGNIPNGSGLSSSASLEVLTGIILKNCFHFDSLALPQIALLGQAAENKYNGMNAVSWINLLPQWEKRIMPSF